MAIGDAIDDGSGGDRQAGVGSAQGEAELFTPLHWLTTLPPRATWPADPPALGLGAHVCDELAASYIVYCSPSRKRQHCSQSRRAVKIKTPPTSACIAPPNPNPVSDSDPSVEVELCAMAVVR